MLIGDEPERGMENLMEVAIPEDVEQGLVKASIKEQEELEKEAREQQQQEKEEEEDGEMEEEKTIGRKRKLNSSDKSWMATTLQTNSAARHHNTWQSAAVNDKVGCKCQCRYLYGIIQK